MKQLLCSLLLCMAVCGTGHAQTSPALEDIIEQGIRLYDEGNYAAALKQYQQALGLDSKNPEATYEMALTYFAMKDMPNAIRYCDAVSKLKNAEPELKAQALVNKGSALDISGNPEQAVKEFRKAIKLAPAHYLAYYNLGLTQYNQKIYKEAEQALVKAVQLRPSHPSSHLLLGYTKQAEKQRVQSLLALYNFLLLEPGSERAAYAFEQLQQMQKEGVSKGEGNTINIMVSADKINDNPFSAAELMLSMMQASNTTEAREGKTPEQLFYENTRSLFSVLGELRKDQQNFWWSYYVEFFHDMLQAKNVETFSHYISQNRSEASAKWLEEHPEQVEQLVSWYRSYKR